ncbi:oxygen-dependent protoporphyrinogen oxidase [Spirilliplanes yamanashiensis]|nr:oxygen-dependent protoporphyrinogen oxidase [Spirilliplanes yamanashiensis]
MRRIAVIGGGIAGLAAAVRLRDRAPSGTEIVVYEQSGRLGGKLCTGELGGLAVERGAESFLAGDPAGGESAAVALARRAGLELAHPARVPAAIAAGGALLPMPAGTLLGVPGDPAALPPLAHATAEPDTAGPLLAEGADVAVGELVRARLGDEVVDRLVDPLLGGVYAGHADQLSLAVTMPALAAAARRTGSLVAAVRAAQAAAVRAPGAPVFAAPAGGMSALVAAVAATSGATIATGHTVREVARTPTGWRLTLGPVPAPATADVDGVVLAVPAKAASRLLARVDACAAHTTGLLDYASVALVGLALPAGADLPHLSGFLVPAVEGRLVKAATFLTTKWPHLGAGATIVRASVGRYGDEAQLQLPDDELAAAVHRDLGDLLGAALPAPAGTFVQRWGGALPQYTPGHLDRVAAVRAALAAAAPGLAVAGAAFDGVGIPACVRSGEAAAEHVLKTLEGPR